jgi:hypothetical protein
MDDLSITARSEEIIRGQNHRNYRNCTTERSDCKRKVWVCTKRAYSCVPGAPEERILGQNQQRLEKEYMQNTKDKSK